MIVELRFAGEDPLLVLQVGLTRYLYLQVQTSEHELESLHVVLSHEAIGYKVKQQRDMLPLDHAALLQE